MVVLQGQTFLLSGMLCGRTVGRRRGGKGGVRISSSSGGGGGRKLGRGKGREEGGSGRVVSTLDKELQSSLECGRMRKVQRKGEREGGGKKRKGE